MHCALLSDVEAERDWVADQVARRWHAGGSAPGGAPTAAVLVRRNADAAPMALIRAKLVIGERLGAVAGDIDQPREAERMAFGKAIAAEALDLLHQPVGEAFDAVARPLLEPADIEPAQVRTSELTVMMMQLVASGRGVCALPNWALTEYLERHYVSAVKLGEQGIWSTLYAAIREETMEAPWMQDFLRTAQETSFAVLSGIRPANRDEESAG